jgi:alkanesulfonate monooxygenase SsuD/methylene tetrahydromethanopterin reductase-like flavin-dependent oxidoreductase (luciferase family)
MTGPRLGAVFRPQLPPGRLRAVAEAADGSGLDELWLWEDCFAEAGLSAAAAALAWTERVHVGIGLLPAPLRNVAITAMEAATLAELFPGRFDLGIGHGLQEWMAQAGVRASSPMTLLREQVIALRALLAGEQVSSQGRYVRLDAVQLGWPPARAPRLVVGAIGPRTVALSAELADATLLTESAGPDGVRRVRAQIDAARSAAGIDGHHEIIAYVMAATGPDAAARLGVELRALGLGPEMSISGGAPELAAGVRRWVEAGADAVVLQPTPDDPDLDGFIELIGSGVRPLL